MKDPFLHGDFDSMDMFTRVTVENALLCFTTPNTKRDSVTPKMTFEFAFAAQQNDLRTSTQKGPKRVWKLLPSVSGSSIKNGRSSSLIVFLRNELDTWAIAFLAKLSSTPNRSFEKIGTDVNEDVTDYVLFRLHQASLISFVKSGSQCGFRCIQRSSNLYACPKGTIYQDLFIYIKIDLYISSFIHQC